MNVQQPVFTFKPLLKRSLFEKLFGLKKTENAFREINNVIAAAPRPSLSDIEKINELHMRYGANAVIQCRSHALAQYRSYLKSCFRSLAHTEISQQDLDDLQTIQRAYLISDEEIYEQNLQVGKSIYQWALKNALSDGVITDMEKAQLTHLGHQLNLDDDVIHQIYAKELQCLLTAKLEAALKDGEMSPEEEREIETICRRFNINHSYEIETQAIVDAAKDLWQAKHGRLTPIEADIALKPREECYHAQQVEWWELSQSRSRMHTRDSKTTSVFVDCCPIVGGTMKQIDAGTLYVTNMRLLFVGLNGTKTLPYTKLINARVCEPFVRIDKDAGRSAYLAPFKNVNSLSALINRMILKLHKNLSLPE